MDISEIQDIYPFARHYHHIRGVRYHYVDVGEGETIVMLHGNPTWSFYFRELIVALSAKYRVIAPDHLGCGLSDKPQTGVYRLESHVDHLETLIQKLNPTTFTLIGHDWGGAIAMGLARRHPEKIKRLIMMNTGAFSMDRLPWRIGVCRVPWLGEFLVRRLNVFCRAAQFMTVTKPMSAQVRRGYMFPYGNYADRVAVYQFVKDIPLSPDHPSYESLLGVEHSLWMFRKTPVCLVWGMKDWCFTPAFLDRWLEFFPHARVLRLPDAGHFVLEDGRDRVIPFIQDFLSDFA